MNAHQQVEPELVGAGNWAVKPSIAGTVVTQIQKSTWKLNLATIFTRSSIEERSIADSNLFRRFLTLERKRAERSGNSFLLVVLHMQDMPQGQAQQKVLAPLQRGIFSTIRNTDFVGWYEKNQPALGILFTEIAEPNEAVTSTILTRMREALSADSAPGLIMKMDVTCHVFPGGESNNSRSVERCARAAD
jgi:hypothetical protein